MDGLTTNEHALVIGGTGMLRGATLDIAKRYKSVTVIARNVARLDDLAREARQFNNHIEPLSLDYRDSEKLNEILERSVQSSGPFNLAVVWIHSVAPRAPHLVARFIWGDYYHILSSSYADPGKVNSRISEDFSSYPNLNYHEVILGFIRQAEGSRWLTHQEIGEGVIKAIQEGGKRFVVGTVGPWSARP